MESMKDFKKRIAKNHEIIDLIVAKNRCGLYKAYKIYFEI